MRILVLEFCNFVDYPIGGYLSFAKQLVKAFGSEISVVGISTDDEPTGVWSKKVLSGHEVRFFNIASISAETKRPFVPRRLTAWYLYMKYRRRIFSLDFDVVFVQTPEALFALPKMKNYQKLIVRVPGLEAPLAISRYWYAKYFSRLFQLMFVCSLGAADAILATADRRNVERFKSRVSATIPPFKIHSFPSRFDDKVFTPKSKTETREELNLNIGATYFVTTGRISEMKGWRLLLDVMEIVKNHIPDSCLIFVGDGEDRGSLETEVEKRGLGQNICITGMLAQQEIAQYLSSADLYLSASEVEGWSTSLMEAVACGLYAVVTDFSSASDLVMHGESGFICEERSPSLFANYVLEALTLDGESSSHRVRWVQEFSQENTRSALEKFF